MDACALDRKIRANIKSSTAAIIELQEGEEDEDEEHGKSVYFVPCFIF